MATITEDYVSFEIAKLLKEKGMDVSCFNHYTQKNNNDGTSEAVTVCTLQMAMKWLREVHNKHIQVGYDIQLSWYYDIIDLKETSFYDYEEMRCWHNDANSKSYEEACEAAIKYSLENLI